MKKKQVRFYVEKELEELLRRLQDFYQIKIQGNLLQYILLLHALDIANLPKDSNWNVMQRRCWLLCQKIKDDMGSAITLRTAKDILAEQKPDDTMSLPELSKLTKEKLVQLAEGKGVSTTGLRKKIKKCQKS